MAQPDKVEAHIFVNKQSRATLEVTNFIASNLAAINHVVKVKIVYINDDVKRMLVAKKITTVPAMLLGGKVYVTAEVIIRALTPARRRVDDMGLAVTNPEEAIMRDQMREMANKGEQEADQADDRDADIRRKMAEMQQRRPVMVGLGKNDKPLPGGRPVKQKSETPQVYDSDQSFVQASRRDNIETTPVNTGYSELDGMAALEEYRNIEADKQGRQHKQGKTWRRPAV